MTTERAGRHLVPWVAPAPAPAAAAAALQLNSCRRLLLFRWLYGAPAGRGVSEECAERGRLPEQNGGQDGVLEDRSGRYHAWHQTYCSGCMLAVQCCAACICLYTAVEYCCSWGKGSSIWAPKRRYQHVPVCCSAFLPLSFRLW